MLSKNNKITAEGQGVDKLGKAFFLLRKNLWKKMAIIRKTPTCITWVPVYVRATGIEITLALPLQHRFKLQLILSSLANYISHMLQ